MSRHARSFSNQGSATSTSFSLVRDNVSNLAQTYNQTGGMTITLGGANTGNEHVGLISPSVTSKIKHRHSSIHGHAVQSLSGGTVQQSAVIRCGV